MELIEQVREIGADQAQVADGSVREARMALSREVARAAAPRRRAGRRRWIGVGGLIAGAAVAAIVAGAVLGPPPGLVPDDGVPSAAAAQVLNEAAAAALHASDASLGPGQYLRIEDTRDYLVTDSAVRGEAVSGNAFRYVETDILYVPADRSGEWVYDFRTPTEITETWGADVDELVDSVMVGYDYRDTGIVRMPGGMRGEGESAYPLVPMLDRFDEMPREPAQLLAWFRDEGGAHSGAEGFGILNALYLNMPPADLRAALFQALALLPDYEVTQRDGSSATLSVSYEDSTAGAVLQQQFVIDTANGMITAMIAPSAEKPGSIVPEGEPGLVETFTVSVVDSAP
ncbi:hypothetical protein [Microbacterium sp.]|uniref:hypothetical protein n=1 Tax=Microbacterium sp. TaxID=51671 RepID=UPI0039E29335